MTHISNKSEKKIEHKIDSLFAKILLKRSRKELKKMIPKVKDKPVVVMERLNYDLNGWDELYTNQYYAIVITKDKINIIHPDKIPTIRKINIENITDISDYEIQYNNDDKYYIFANNGKRIFKCKL